MSLVDTPRVLAYPGIVRRIVINYHDYLGAKLVISTRAANSIFHHWLCNRVRIAQHAVHGQRNADRSSQPGAVAAIDAAVSAG